MEVYDGVPVVVYPSADDLSRFREKRPPQAIADGLLRVCIGDGMCAIFTDRPAVRAIVSSGVYFNMNEYGRGGVRKDQSYIARLIMQPRGKDVVDHYNQASRDCRDENMRVVSIGVNNINRERTTETGVRGVIRYGAAFAAFWTEEDGTKTYDRIPIGLYGKDAALNIAIRSRKRAENNISHYILAAIPPIGYTPSRHYLHPKYFDSTVVIDPLAPIEYISKEWFQ